jgi:hypothetical protein
VSAVGPPWARLEGFRWKPPQRCPYCLEDATVRQEDAVVIVTGCPCTAPGVLRVHEWIARRRWRQLGVE